MGRYILKKFVYMIIMLLVVSLVGFILIQLPPGDFMTSYTAELRASGQEVNEEIIQAMRQQYGLDLPVYQQYFLWLKNILHGDFGLSFQWKKPVSELLGERMMITILISVLTLIFSYIFAIVAGIYSAVRQYSAMDYLLTVFAFIGMSIPNFILTLLIVYFAYLVTGSSMVGLFSPEFISAPWNWARLMDLMKHLPIPIFVCGVSGMASLFRITRGCMLDELNKTYVTATRARGLSETRLLLRYPTRIAMNPIVSSVAWVLPGIISGGTIVAVIMALPTVAPMLLTALKTQDMYLAGIIVVFLSMLTIVGTFVSDILLVFVDPRVKVEQ